MVRRVFGFLIPVVVLSILSFPGWASIPTSEKAERIVRKIEPKLEAQLRRRGFEFGSDLFIRIFKKSSELEMWVKKDGLFELFRTYRICKYSGGLGPKLKAGDRQSPEGFYSVTSTQLNPNSDYHLSFNVGFPNAYDRAQQWTGGSIMIHGNCGSRGCFAMTDKKMEEIYTLVAASLKNGQDSVPVHIYPFKMTEGNLHRYENSPWYPFWANLKEGYDYFEANRLPPEVVVRDNRYAITRPAYSYLR